VWFREEVQKMLRAHVCRKGAPAIKKAIGLEAKALAAKEKESSKPKLQFKSGFDQEKVNAYHEAGHAVFGELIGPGVEITTIDPHKVVELTGRECPGYTRCAGPDGQKADFITIMCMTLAGLTSEATYATNGMISPKEDDLQQAEAVLDQAGLSGPAREQEYLRCRMVTQEMVKKYRAEIEIVGNALADRKTLTGADVRSLVMSVSQKS
jgi:ATP-dependent Zn protease